MVRAREHSRELMKAFAPMRIFLTLIGQMPFTIKAKPDGTYHFKFYKKSLACVLYILLYTIFTANYGIISVSVALFLIGQEEFNQEEVTPVLEENLNNLGAYKRRYTNWEKYQIQRYFVMTLVVWSWMTLALIGATYLITHGKKYVHYANYWNRSVQNMDMNVTAGVRAYIIRENCFCVALVVVALILTAVPNVDVLGGTCNVLTNFYFRLFRLGIPKQLINREEEKEKDPNGEWKFYAFKAPGFFIMNYAYLASRANIMQFVFFNRLLINASRIWNARLRNSLAEVPEDPTGRDKTLVRLDLRFVLKDHFTLVQLFKMTEDVFSQILLGYYLLNLMDVTLEVYHLASLRYEDPRLETRQFNALDTITLTIIRLNSEKERQDWLFCLQNASVTILTGTQAIVFVYLTTRVAARAYEEAMGGFQILRRNVYLENCDTKEERNFTHTMIVSFAPNNPLQVTAGGYFPINKALLPGLLGTVAGYFVACYTLKPDKGNFWSTTVQ